MPPPYPDYPVPQSYFDPAVNPYQPTQTTPVSVDPWELPVGRFLHKLLTTSQLKLLSSSTRFRIWT